MARKRDRTGEAKFIFLKSAIISRSSGVNALPPLKGKRYTYHDLIYALFGSIADQVARTGSSAREEGADNGRGDTANTGGSRLEQQQGRGYLLTRDDMQSTRKLSCGISKLAPQTPICP